MVSRRAQEIAAELRARPPVRGLSLEQWRAGAGESADPELPAGGHVEAVDAGGVASEWAWFDPETGDGPTVLWFHGGGFVLCTVATHRYLAARVAATVGGRALVVGYRRPPERPFPAAVLDGMAAYRFALEAAPPGTRVVLAGDSAGGNLAITVTLAALQSGLPAPAAVLAVSPWTDLTLSADSLTRLLAADPFAHLDDLPRMRDLYLAGSDPRQPLASPLFADLAHLSVLPPTLVVVGDTETLLDDSTRFVARAAAAGAPASIEIVPGAFHTWLGYPDLREADAALAVIGAFLRDHAQASS